MGTDHVVLITGAKGQLGVEVTQQLIRAGFQVHAFGREELDVTNMHQVLNAFEQIRPTIVIHLAAYTNVDEAEENVEYAFWVNGLGTRNIAVAAEQLQAKLFYVSTDHVFDGQQERPYFEFSPTSPINIYGESKRAGEQMVQMFHSQFFIIRTSWLYGRHGSNFVNTLLKLFQTQNQLNVIQDQFGSPTYTLDLTMYIINLLPSFQYGIYHIVNTGVCSWYELAIHIVERLNLSHNIRIHPIQTAELSRAALRPTYGILDMFTLRSSGFPEPRQWREALDDYLSQFS